MSGLTITRQHHEGAEVEEFPFDWTDEAKVRMGLKNLGHFAVKHQAPFDLLPYAMCFVDTSKGGWVTISVGGEVKAAHPRALARQHGAEWVGNLGAGK